MGWNGIGIGWPNASAQSNPTVYFFDVYECEGFSYPVYSLNNGWAVGAYIYVYNSLTIPASGSYTSSPPSYFDELYTVTAEGLITDVVSGQCQP